MNGQQTMIRIPLPVAKGTILGTGFVNPYAYYYKEGKRYAPELTVSSGMVRTQEDLSGEYLFLYERILIPDVYPLVSETSSITFGEIYENYLLSHIQHVDSVINTSQIEQNSFSPEKHEIIFGAFNADIIDPDYVSLRTEMLAQDYPSLVENFGQVDDFVDIPFMDRILLFSSDMEQRGSKNLTLAIRGSGYSSSKRGWVTDLNISFRKAKLSNPLFRKVVPADASLRLGYQYALRSFPFPVGLANVGSYRGQNIYRYQQNALTIKIPDITIPNDRKSFYLKPIVKVTNTSVATSTNSNEEFLYGRGGLYFAQGVLIKRLYGSRTLYASSKDNVTKTTNEAMFIPEGTDYFHMNAQRLYTLDGDYEKIDLSCNVSALIGYSYFFLNPLDKKGYYFIPDNTTIGIVLGAYIGTGDGSLYKVTDILKISSTTLRIFLEDVATGQQISPQDFPTKYTSTTIFTFYKRKLYGLAVNAAYDSAEAKILVYKGSLDNVPTNIGDLSALQPFKTLTINGSDTIGLPDSSSCVIIVQGIESLVAVTSVGEKTYNTCYWKKNNRDNMIDVQYVNGVGFVIPMNNISNIPKSQVALIW